MTGPSHLADSFRAVLRDRSRDTLLVAPSEGVTLTAADIDGQAADLASGLQGCRLTAGDLVMSCTGNLAAMPALVLACLRLGMPLMPVDRSTPSTELRGLARRWCAAGLVVPASIDLRPDANDSSPLAIERYPLGHGLAAWVVSQRPAPGRHAPAAVLKLTSGSTGEPRATCSEERHLLADVRHIAEAMHIGPRTWQLGVIPLSHSYGFSNLLLPLLWQGTPLLLRPQFVPTQVVPDVTAGRLETFAGVPFMFDHLARHQALEGLHSLRLVVSAGARLAWTTVSAFHAATGLKVRSFYGSSETGGICFDDSAELDPRVPVGRVMGTTRITLEADDDAPAGSGRVRVTGPSVIDRYAGDGPRFDGSFLTSDYAEVTGDGHYVLTGRAPSFVNVAGRKVQPQEVEAALRLLPGVSDAVAMGVDDDVRGQALGACLVSDAEWDARSVRAALAQRLAAHKLPRVVVVMRALPVTDRGKVDRAAIAKLLTRS